MACILSGKKKEFNAVLERLRLNKTESQPATGKTQFLRHRRTRLCLSRTLLLLSCSAARSAESEHNVIN